MMDSFRRIRHRLPDLVATMCAACMLCLVPLLFHDAFFDINRVKVSAVLACVPGFSAAMIAALLLDPQRKARFSSALPGKAPCLLLLLFIVSCIVACAFAGFEEAVMTGSEGRYCGLFFMVCCACAFFVTVLGRVHTRFLLPAIMLCSCACAFLGVLNAMGVDPLRFYTRIQKGQEKVFLSTIGHFDFFGTFLVLLFPLSAAQYVFSSKCIMRIFGLFCAVVIAFGASVSRTDSAFAGLHMACFLLAAISGRQWAYLSRSLLIWALAFGALPITYTMLKYSIFQPDISGLPKILYQLHAGEALCVLLLILSFFCLMQRRQGRAVPGRKKLLVISIILFCMLAAAVFGAVIWFSVFDTQTPLGSAASFLRFNDRWGSLRGFVYTRSLRAFSEYSVVEKVFGVGMDLARRVLSPYFDDPAMLVYGVFNDPHCQPLQMLLTCGLFGMISYLALYVSMLFTFFRHAKEEPVLCGVLCSLFSFSLIMLINVTQPILILTYFSVCALGISHLRAITASGGIAHES